MSDNTRPVPEGAKPLKEQCGACEVAALHIESRLVAQPLGTFSLSGNQPKMPARIIYYLVCRACDVEYEGTVVEGTHVMFPPEAVKGGKRL